MKARDHTGGHLRWWHGAGIERADLAIRRPTGDMVWHRDLRLEELPLAWARAQNVRQADVYIRPARGYDWPLVLLDDVGLEMAAKIARKYDCLVIRTSPAGGCHLWLSCARALDEEERANAQRWLAARVGADPGSVSGEHLGRLAGFKNWKRAGAWVNVLVASRGVGRWEATSSRWERGSPPTLRKARVATSDGNRGRDTSESGQEWGWVCGLLEAGCDPSLVHSRLLMRAGPRRGADAPRYARRTVERALARTAIARSRRGPDKEPPENHLGRNREGRVATM